MDRRFLVVSGLPGSGKSTLARQLSAALGLPLLDKDEILERLFETQGAGDAAQRRTLSRESDRVLEAGARASRGAVLVSHWHLPGMAQDSGTPTGWLRELSPRLVHVYCRCDAQLAAERFLRRKRHAGHLDSVQSPEEIRASIARVESCGRLALQPGVEVDTSRTVALDDVLACVLAHFEGS